MRHERKSSETNKQAADYWRALWRDRCVNITSGEILASLIKANGFDSGCGDYTVSQWKTMSETLCASLNISRSSCVLEVGCGSGALLYAIQLCSQAKVFGYDYSKSLISAAKQLINGEFRVSEAPVNPFREELFDFAISHSVFQYFPTLEYAFQTIVSMSAALRPGGKIALLDLNDAETKDAYHNARKLASGHPDAYETKYRRYPHQFYDKHEIMAFLESLGFREIEFLQHSVAEYLNSTYRFNIVGIKK